MSILRLRRRDEDWSLSSSTLDIAVASDGADYVRGPLGLNLLHCPLEPQIEVIFVHGLGGGSKKTWSKTSATHQYWPQEWIPNDPAFQFVRVYSYGYDTDWRKGKDNCLNIHHIGKLFLGEVSTSPDLANSSTPIIFVGHSLGGLIIKKAIMLAKQGADYEKLRERFHTIYFLATPHRGSDSANLLNNILRLAHSSRAYVADLVRGSGVLQAINDEFRNYSEHIKLWSFYETQKLKIGLHSTLIVDPESATLGYREEIQMPMNADHRSICKYDTPTDPNYVMFRNSLRSTIQSIENLAIRVQDTNLQSQIRDLENFLNLSDKPENDLSILEDSRMRGTCEWFSNREYYQKWKETAGESLSLLWMIGKPATGKSVLAGYVINQLQSSMEGCSYFFFKHGDKNKSRLSYCLRSLALQMACANVDIRAILLGIYQDGTNLEIDNERDIWRRLFLDGIFQKQMSIQYWVVDALDECMSNGIHFIQLLARLDWSIPVKILITSRESPELKKRFQSLTNLQVRYEGISLADTSNDIKSVVEEKSKSVLSKSDADRTSMTEKLLEKSEGSFLWAVLVLHEMANAHSEKEMNQALEETPRDMGPLYSRILESMTASPSGNKLAKGILTWVACAVRPLTLKELEGALILDLDDSFPNLAESIQTLCGNIVTIDKFDKVKMVHSTAREFLFEKDLRSYFALHKTDAHTRITRACLKYLNSEDMRPPRTARRGPARQSANNRAPFSDYACTAFSYHLARASPLANDVTVLTEGFFKLNVLTWIEVVAQTKHLLPLIHTAKNLKRYLNACTVERSPLGSPMQTIRGWSTDLTRIAAKFAHALTASPSAIYALIPPFCPTESMISKIVFPGRRLSILGLSNRNWDDRLFCIDYREGQTSALSYGDEYLAVGRTNGAITLYDVTSCQEYTDFDHGEAVRFLQFQPKSPLMVSGGIKTIRVWNTGVNEVLYQFGGPRRLMGLFFDRNLLVATSSEEGLRTWDLDEHGLQQPDKLLIDESQQMQARGSHTPSAISMAVAHKMVAIAYNGRPITLWDLEEHAYYGQCGKKLSSGITSTHPITALLFNPNPNIGLLAASYLDGDLVLLDPFDDREIERFRANCHTLSASPNGRLLAGGTGGGYIQIYEFESLDLLYRVSSSNIFIKQLAFSKDNLHFADIRGSHCNIWEPADLLQSSIGEGSSQATSASVIDVAEPESKIKICAMLLHPKGDFAFCGKDTGSVTLYHMTTGVEIRQLYSHKSVVHILEWWSQRNIIISIDISNKIYAWSLKRDNEGYWLADDMVFQSRLDCGRSVSQLLIGDDNEKFIISTRESDHLWNIGGQQEDVRVAVDGAVARRWMQHPQSTDHMICFEGTSLHARLHAWSDWSEVTSINLSIDMMGFQVKSSFFYASGFKIWILLELSRSDGYPETRGLHIFEVGRFKLRTEASFTVETGPMRPKDTADQDSRVEEVTSAMKEAHLVLAANEQLQLLSQYVSRVIGITEDKKLLFLDTHSWVSSVDLEMLNDDVRMYRRHFFVPYEWFAGTREILCAIARQDVIFARNDNVAIIKGGLGYSEYVSLERKMN